MFASSRASFRACRRSHLRLVVGALLAGSACAAGAGPSSRPAGDQDPGNEPMGTPEPMDARAPSPSSQPPAGENPDAPATAAADTPAAVPSEDAPASTDARVADSKPAADALISPPGCAGYRVCDSFESFAVGSQPKPGWSISSSGGGGTVTVDGTRAFSGQKSVRIVVPQSVAGTGIVKSGAPLFPLPNNEVWGRMMMWLAERPINGPHWQNIGGSGPVPGHYPSANYSYGGQGNVLMANYYSDKVSDCWRHSKTGIPEKRWACIEWHFDGPKNTMEYWLDGKKLDDLTVVLHGNGCFGPNDWYAPMFDHIAVGWWQAQKSPIVTEMWIDDVVMDPKGQIGCPKLP